MASLHNRVSSKILKEKALQDYTPRTTLSFYSYCFIEDPIQYRDNWYTALHSMGVMGRIYIAHEGINAQISCPNTQIQGLRDFIYDHPQLNSLRLNTAVDENSNSFYVLNIKVRKNIVADGIADPNFTMLKKGRYVDAVRFNEMVKHPETLVIDMRNHYEFEVGRFKTAIEIPSDTFREQLPMAADMFSGSKDKNIIMYCTGGIRCEKASAWMLHKGFKNVFHLEGGIIHYINQVRDKNLDNHFIGKNFVFDERLGERITEEIIANCHTCGKPCDTHVNCKNSRCHLLFIQCGECQNSMETCCSRACKDFNQLSIEERQKVKAEVKGLNIFNKSKARVRSIQSAT